MSLIHLAHFADSLIALPMERSQHSCLIEKDLSLLDTLCHPLDDELSQLGSIAPSTGFLRGIQFIGANQGAQQL